MNPSRPGLSIPRPNRRSAVAGVGFLLTLVPLGMAHTVYGRTAAWYALMLAVLGGVALICIVLVAPRLADTAGARRALSFGSSVLFAAEPVYRLIIFGVPLTAAYLCGYWLSGNWPYVADSIAQFAHARVLAGGQLTAAGHPYPEFFPVAHAIHAARWFSMYPPGHLFALAAGHWVGAPALVNPLLCGLSSTLVYGIAKDHYSLREARIAGVMAAFCPLWWLMASEYMNHNTALFALLLFTWSLLRMLRRSSLGYAVMAGAGLALAILTRPLTALAVALPFIAYTLWVLRRGQLSSWLYAGVVGLISLAAIIGQFLYNVHTTGQWWLFGHQILYGDQANLGFGQVITTGAFVGYDGTAHSLWRGIGNASNNLIGLNAFLFNWPIPSLLFVFVGLAVFRSGVALTALMIYSWVALTGAYVFYFYQDWCLGPRYQHEITGFLLIMTAVGIARTPATIRALGCRMRRSTLRRSLAAGICALYVGAALLWTAMLPRGLSYCKAPAVSPGKIDAQIPDHSLVLANRSYTALTVFMPPSDEDRVIYAKDLGARNHILTGQYPDRDVYLETPGGFRLIRAAR